MGRVLVEKSVSDVTSLVAIVFLSVCKLMLYETGCVYCFNVH